MEHKRRFTLIEVLVVMSIVLVLAGMLLVGVSRARAKARSVQVEADFRLMETAISSYRTTYAGLYPFHATINTDINNPSDYLFADAPWIVNGPVFGDLLTTLQSEHASWNPRRIAFLEGGVADEDPWGNSYRVAVDTEYDDDLEAAVVYGTDSVLNKGIAIWSRGPDMLDDSATAHESNADNLNSWD